MADPLPPGPLLVRAKKNKNPYRIHESVQLDIIDFIESGIGFSDEEVAAAYNVRSQDIAKLRQIIPLKEEYGVTSLGGRRATRHNRVAVPDAVKVEILNKKALASLPSATVGLMYGVTCMAIHVLRRDRAKVLRRYKLGHKERRDHRNGSREGIVPFDEEVLRWMDATPGCKPRHILEFARSIAPEYGKPSWFKATYGWWERFRHRYNLDRFGDLIADMEGYDGDDFSDDTGDDVRVNPRGDETTLGRHVAAGDDTSDGDVTMASDDMGEEVDEDVESSGDDAASDDEELDDELVEIPSIGDENGDDASINKGHDVVFALDGDDVSYPVKKWAAKDLDGSSPRHDHVDKLKGRDDSDSNGDDVPGKSGDETRDDAQGDDWRKEDDDDGDESESPVVSDDDPIDDDDTATTPSDDDMVAALDSIGDSHDAIEDGRLDNDDDAEETEDV